MNWNTNRALIPNREGTILRVRLFDGRETTTIIDRCPSAGFHLRNVPINTVAAWRKQVTPEIDWTSFDSRYWNIV